MEKLFILKILEDTCVDGTGFRTAIYSAGCGHHCKGCHNPSSWNITNGELMSVKSVLNKVLADPFADVTFTGGDPMLQADSFAVLAELIKSKSNKNIWCYTGYKFEECVKLPSMRKLLNYVDVLVDGKYMEDLRDPELRFRGSSNQRIIDVPQSLKEGKIVLYQFNY